ncbi:MAG TPA: hypothetical protein PKA00_14900 [Saprospiraceae bacterium]|nr:hypothetical protein [Saprospiraceae bacterium]HMQ84200.1 hypothetical protein [Saprospiraceae bacterium]
MKKLSYFHSLMSLLLPLLATGFMASCETGKNTLVTADSLLINCWTHSYEEESGGVEKIYRPCDYQEFPPSRYRNTYIFKENNVCEYLTLAPNDAHTTSNGTWAYSKTDNKLIIKQENGVVLAELGVLELAADKLVLKPLN